MKKLIILTFIKIGISIVSCKSTSSLPSTDPPALKEAIDLVYEQALRYEMKEVGNAIYIVDSAMGKSTYTSEEFNFVKNDTLESYKWNQNIFTKFTKFRYLNKEVIAFQISKTPKEYFKMVRKLTKPIGTSMYEVWLPKFTKDRKLAAIELFYNNSSFHEIFYVHFTMIFKWKKNKYQFVKYHEIDRHKE